MVVRYGAAARLLHCGGEPAPSCGRSANPRLVSPPAPQAFGFRVPAPGPRLVLFRGFGSPAVCLRGSGNLRLPKAYAFGHALFPFAAPGAGTPGLRPGVCLPSLAAEPLRVSLLVAGPATAVPALCRRAACGVSPWRRGALPPRSDFRLARRRSPRAFFLSFLRKRESIGSVLTPFVLPAKSGNAPYLSFPRMRESGKIM